MFAILLQYTYALYYRDIRKRLKIKLAARFKFRSLPECPVKKINQIILPQILHFFNDILDL